MLPASPTDAARVPQRGGRAAGVPGLEGRLFRVQEVRVGHEDEVQGQERILGEMSMVSKFYGYGRALKSQSKYAQRMKLLSNSIFGEVKRPTSKESMKVVTHMSKKPYEDRKELVEYYPAYEEIAQLMGKLREYGLFRDEHADFVEEMDRLRKLRGKEKVHWGKKKRGEI